MRRLLKLPLAQQYSILQRIACALQELILNPASPRPADTASLHQVVEASRQLRREAVWVVGQSRDWRLVSGAVIVTCCQGVLLIDGRRLPSVPAAVASLPEGRVFLRSLERVMSSPPPTPRLEYERHLRPSSPHTDSVHDSALHSFRCPQRHSEQDSVLISFRCPITLSLLVDPVVADDGHTYERAAISRWLSRPGPGVIRSPCTNLPLASGTLTANHALKSAIMEWMAQRG